MHIEKIAQLYDDVLAIVRTPGLGDKSITPNTITIYNGLLSQLQSESNIDANYPKAMDDTEYYDLLTMVGQLRTYTSPKSVTSRGNRSQRSIIAHLEKDQRS